MYGLSDEISGQSERIEELKNILIKCRKYIWRLPNENELEEEMILDIINSGNI
jgi:hypothetical protein